MKRVINILFFILLAGALSAQGKAKYVFFFIGDGMGMNQVNGTEMYLAEKAGYIGAQSLLFTQFPVTGIVTTFSLRNSVTDSAAAGTALATGSKTTNGTLGLDVDGNRLASVAEKAKRAGRKVGITTSVSVDHATPAAFYAHQSGRNKSYEIALDLIEAGFDFYAGSGFLRPDSTYDNRNASNVFGLFESAGYTVARGYNDFKSNSSKASKIILIQEDGKAVKALPYAIDRKAGDLTLTQITESAIASLSKNAPKGFFLMVEGGKIDWACHDNDAATAFDEVVDMDNAIKVAYEFYKKHPKETLIIITADHETGGIHLGTGKYALNLKALRNQKCSQDALSDRIKDLRKSKPQVSWEDVRTLLSETMGFWKELPLTWLQERKLRDTYEESFSETSNARMEKNLYSESEPLAAKAKEVINEIAMIGWGSGGHSAGYVPVFAIGADAQLFMGKMDNTDIPKRIAKAGGY
ncbi:Alkaline phosphatase [termite gut metagenome]|uniref:Alkaline phosphatase n=1 Tax=termite gut metagenome TaxID=433724 RepID=A0A5J4SN38_9ZZZZ